MRSGTQHQRGVTLIIALIMLTALALLAAWAVKSGTMNLRVVGNTQARQEAMAAAQAAIETTISSPLFVQQPAAVAAVPIPVDVDGDGKTDETVTLTPAPACYKYRPVKMSDLDVAKAADLACMRSGAATLAGIDATPGTPAGDSLCADSEWNIRAAVTNATTGATAAVNQGVAVRAMVTDAANSCP
jgi:hypothetical protein